MCKCESTFGGGGLRDGVGGGGSHHGRAESGPADRESSSGNRRLSPSTGPSCRRFAVHRERRSSHSESRRIGKMEADSARSSGQEVTFQRNEGCFVRKRAARRRRETGRLWYCFECPWPWIRRNGGDCCLWRGAREICFLFFWSAVLRRRSQSMDFRDTGQASDDGHRHRHGGQS